MKTITTHAKITEDGILRLEVPCDLPPGLVEVTLVVQLTRNNSEANNVPPYQSLCGIWYGKLPDVDVDVDLKEMNQKWEKSLEVSE